MGTAGFAVPSFERLMDEGYEVVAVVTAPDKPAGRGRKLRPSPVKVAAQKHQIPLLQPINLKEESFLNALTAFKPDVQIVVAFRMLPEAVWALPPLGTINLHASLLPQYRGAAPINHAIMNGETVTGVTTFMIDKEIDTGKILFREKTPIHPDESAGEVHDRLMILGADLVVKTVKAIQTGNIHPIPQEELLRDIPELKKAPKIFRDDCRIDWNNNAKDIHNFIRGLSPSPCAFTEISMHSGTKQVLKIYRGKKKNNLTDKLTGQFSSDNKTFLEIQTDEGSISLLEVQIEGKKRMTIEEFLRGFDIHSIASM